MTLRILKSFRDKFDEQVRYIAEDKPGAARKFKTDILKRIKEIPSMPYACRKSIFFERDDIRDMVFKGYVIVYKVDNSEKVVTVFGFSKYKDNPFEK